MELSEVRRFPKLLIERALGRTATKPAQKGPSDVFPSYALPYGFFEGPAPSPNAAIDAAIAFDRQPRP